MAFTIPFWIASRHFISNEKRYKKHAALVVTSKLYYLMLVCLPILGGMQCNNKKKNRGKKCKKWKCARLVHCVLCRICLRNSCRLSEAVQTARSSDIFTLQQMANTTSLCHLATGMAQQPPLHTHNQILSLLQHSSGKSICSKKPQELVLLCFQTRSDSNYHKIYCTTRGEAVIYFGSQPKWKTRSQSLSSLCAGPKTPHGGSRV